MRTAQEVHTLLLAYENYNETTGGDPSSKYEQTLLEWVMGGHTLKYQKMLEHMREMTDGQWATRCVAARSSD